MKRLCNVLKGKLEPKRMADLPVERVSPWGQHFMYVGVDCFGPFFVKRGRSQIKRYQYLLTCLSVRAVHIEKLDTLDADTFINALMRFSARRGVSAKIRSDNRTRFVAGERELREAIQNWN